MSVLQFPDLDNNKTKNSDYEADRLLWEFLDICKIQDNNEQIKRFGLYSAKVVFYLSDRDCR